MEPGGEPKLPASDASCWPVQAHRSEPDLSPSAALACSIFFPLKSVSQNVARATFGMNCRAFVT